MRSHLATALCFLCVMLVFMTPFQSHARKDRTTISYLIGFPTGELNDFIDDTSYQGLEIDFTTPMSNEQHEMGLLLGFQRFKKSESNATHTDSSTGAVITGDQERSFDTWPVLFKWRMNPWKSGSINGFFGAAAGVAYVERRFFVGSFNFSNYGWQILLRPEIGATYMLSDNGGIEASLRYDYGFKTSALPSYGAVTVGIGYAIFY